ncbi:hypothetical protein [Caballeronia sp. INML1]|uniref:hypothetical protein n=1 Tax=Caballeronia sp. INML1 TaxID=2921760 RepID=UPI0020285C8F|nr:hypothetical protein [Caballeronia sp. INML1]
MTAKREALTLADIERLFDKMHETWGERFLKHWAGCDMASVHHTWLEGLDDLDRKAIRYGTSAMLLDNGGPIDLPRFRGLCLRGRMQQTFVPPMLTEAWKMTPTARIALDHIRAILGSVEAKIIAIPNYGRDDTPLPSRVPSPHIYQDELPQRQREPGDDDAGKAA